MADEEEFLPEDVEQELEALFRETGRAHHEAFEEAEGEDPDWPIWYAEFLEDKLPDLIEAAPTKSELIYLLVLANKQQAMDAPGGDWPRYYARFFSERYL